MEATYLVALSMERPLPLIPAGGQTETINSLELERTGSPLSLIRLYTYPMDSQDTPMLISTGRKEEAPTSSALRGLER